MLIILEEIRLFLEAEQGCKSSLLAPMQWVFIFIVLFSSETYLVHISSKKTHSEQKKKVHRPAPSLYPL